MLGVSLDTVDRRLRGLPGEGCTPSGMIGLPAAAIAEHLCDAWPRRGRPPRIDDRVVARIVRQRNSGWTFAAIAGALNADGIETVHGGARWWPATVRKILLHAERSKGSTKVPADIEKPRERSSPSPAVHPQTVLRSVCLIKTATRSPGRRAQSRADGEADFPFDATMTASNPEMSRRLGVPHSTPGTFRSSHRVRR